MKCQFCTHFQKFFLFISNQVLWGTTFITDFFSDFCSKNSSFNNVQYFYYMKMGYFQNIIPTSSFITLIYLIVCFLQFTYIF